MPLASNRFTAASKNLRHLALTLALAVSVLVGVGGFAQLAQGQAAPPVIELDILDLDGVPADATAAVLNVAAARAASSGYVVAWPCDQPRPTTSILNYRPGAAVSNSTIVQLSATGTVCLARSGYADLIVDLNSVFRSAGTFNGQNPERVLDTRDSEPVTPGRTVALTIAGNGSTPANATATAVNIAAARAVGEGYVVAWPCDQPKPDTSALNYRSGPAVSNTTTVALSSDGRLCLDASTTTDLIVDVNGAFVDAEAERFTPRRVTDTRLGRRIQAGETVQVQISGEPGVPADAVAAAVNLTAARPSSPGYVVAWPCGTPEPLAASLNYDTRPVSNTTILGIGSNGRICLKPSTAVDLIVDLNGAFTTSSNIDALTPLRIIDTRETTGTGGTGGSGSGSGSGGGTAPVAAGGDFVETFDANAGLDRFNRGVFHRDVDLHGFPIGSRGQATWTGDHDANCGSPATQRVIDKVDRAGVFYTCRDHLMTSVGAVDSYSLAWFSPKQVFTAATTDTVSWDVNVTNLLARQWWEVVLVDPDSSELIAHPTVAGVAAAPPGSSAPGLIPYPEGSVAVGNGPFAPGPIKINGENQGWQPICTTPSALDPEGCASKPIRRTFTITDNRNGTITVDFLDHSWTVAGSFPDEFKVVFKDHNYTPDKDGPPVGHTWHWDNIIVR